MQLRHQRTLQTKGFSSALRPHSYFMLYRYIYIYIYIQTGRKEDQFIWLSLYRTFSSFFPPSHLLFEPWSSSNSLTYEYYNSSRILKLSNIHSVPAGQCAAYVRTYALTTCAYIRTASCTWGEYILNILTRTEIFSLGSYTRYTVHATILPNLFLYTFFLSLSFHAAAGWNIFLFFPRPTSCLAQHFPPAQVLTRRGEEGKEKELGVVIELKKKEGREKEKKNHIHL